MYSYAHKELHIHTYSHNYISLEVIINTTMTIGNTELIILSSYPITNAANTI